MCVDDHVSTTHAISAPCLNGVSAYDGSFVSSRLICPARATLRPLYAVCVFERCRARRFSTKVLAYWTCSSMEHFHHCSRIHTELHLYICNHTPSPGIFHLCDRGILQCNISDHYTAQRCCWNPERNPLGTAFDCEVKIAFIIARKEIM